MLNESAIDRMYFGFSLSVSPSVGNFSDEAGYGEQVYGYSCLEKLMQVHNVCDNHPVNRDSM